MSDAVEDQLKSFRGSTRLLIVFGPSETDGQVTTQLENFRNNHDALNERDVRVFSVLESAAPAAGGTPADWRRRFDVGPNNFTVVLVGKDGTEKHRWVQPVSLAEIETLVDAMPMRQAEMRQEETRG